MVIDSRELTEKIYVRRRRECEKCGVRFTTMEEIKPGSIKIPVSFEYRKKELRLK